MPRQPMPPTPPGSSSTRSFIYMASRGVSSRIATSGSQVRSRKHSGTSWGQRSSFRPRSTLKLTARRRLPTDLWAASCAVWSKTIQPLGMNSYRARNSPTTPPVTAPRGIPPSRSTPDVIPTYPSTSYPSLH